MVLSDDNNCPMYAPLELNAPMTKKRMLGPGARVAALTISVVVASVGLLLVLPNGVRFDSENGLMLAALTIVFVLSERVVFHIEARSEAVSYTPTELGLGLGILFLFPLELVAARFVGALIGMLIWRRPRASKVLFNLAHFTLETLIAVAVFRLIIGIHGGVAMTWVAMLLGLNLALFAGALMVAAAISQLEGQLGPRLRTAIVTFPIFHFPAAVFATLIASCALVDPWLGLFAFTPAPVMWFMIRSHAGLMHRHRDLTNVHDFSRVVGDATDLHEIGSTAADQIASTSRAERVTLRLWTIDGSPIDAAVGRPISPRDLPAAPTDPAWSPLLDSREPWRIAPDNRLSPASAVGRKAGVEHGLIYAITDEQGPVGVAVLADRQGMSVDFDDDDVARVTAMVQQLTIVVRKAQLHSQIQHEAAHDRLTGLPNRSYFEAWVDDRAGKAGQSRAVLLMDLDRFKEINDAFGHHAGDSVLIEAAARIRAVCGPLDLPARFGGDEFAVLVTIADSVEAASVAEKLSLALEEPFEIGAASVAIGASIGIAMAPEHGRAAAGLLKRADIAMYDAKNRHVRYSLYRYDLEESDSTRLMLLSDLRTALRDGEIEVHYQPQIDVETGWVIGAEALARWNHGEHGPVSPEVFVGLAEQSGLIEELTQQVLTQATAAAVQWQRRGWDLGVSVNISAQSLLDEGLHALVAEVLESTGLPAERLTLEITETTMMSDTTRTNRVLESLARLGVRLAVDDFGTGYSSLSYLRHSPVSELKIDRRFISDLMNDENDDIIVRSTIDLAQNLGLRVVAEGVENDEVSARLRELGCNVAQGFGISKPIPAQQFLFWVVDGQTPRLLIDEPERVEAQRRKAPPVLALDEPESRLALPAGAALEDSKLQA